MKYFLDYLRFSLVFGLLGALIIYWPATIKRHEKERAQQQIIEQKRTILWSGYSNESFDVKLISYGKSGDKYLIGEEIISGVIWAKVSLLTPGSLPVLYYIEKACPGQLKFKSCSSAEVI